MSRRRTERGTVSIEVVALVPILVLVGMLTLQLGVAWWTGSQAQDAARQAARAQSLGDSPRDAAEGALPGALDVESISAGEDSVRIEVEVPRVSFLPTITVTRDAFIPGAP